MTLDPNRNTAEHSLPTKGVLSHLNGAPYRQTFHSSALQLHNLSQRKSRESKLIFAQTLTLQNLARRAWLFRIVALMVSLFDSLAGELTAKASLNVSPADEFKLFVSAPPVIECLVFRTKLSPQTSKPGPIDSRFSVPSDLTCFHARWQPDATLLRRMPSASDVSNYTIARLFVSVFKDNYWMVNGGPRAIQWTRNSGASNSVYRMANDSLFPLRKLLNFGVMHVPIGSIVWSGNHFLIKTTLLPEFDRIEGEIIALPDQPPSEMRVTYSGPSRFIEHRVRYGYEPPLELTFAPRTISSFSVRQNGEFKIDETMILDLKIAAMPSEKSQFDGKTFVAENRLSIDIYTNKALYSLQPDGSLSFVRSDSSMSDSPKSLRVRRPPEHVFPYALWLGANIGIMVLTVRMVQHRESEEGKR